MRRFISATRVSDAQLPTSRKAGIRNAPAQPLQLASSRASSILIALGRRFSPSRPRSQGSVVGPATCRGRSIARAAGLDAPSVPQASRGGGDLISGVPTRDGPRVTVAERRIAAQMLHHCTGYSCVADSSQPAAAGVSRETFAAIPFGLTRFPRTQTGRHAGNDERRPPSAFKSGESPFQCVHLTGRGVAEIFGLSGSTCSDTFSSPTGPAVDHTEHSQVLSSLNLT